MKSILTRLFAVMMSLVLILPPIAQAQGIDPAARGLAAQARATAQANAALTKGLSYYSFAPAGQTAIRKRNVVYNFVEPSGHYLSTTGVGTLTNGATFPVAAPTGQTAGAKLVTASTATSTSIVRSFTFAAAASGGNLPSTFGAKTFAKASGQVLYALVYVDGDPYQINTSYSDNVFVRFEKDGSNYYDFYFSSGSTWLKAGWNFLPMRWDASNSAVERVPSKTGTVNDGDTITRVAVGTLTGSTTPITLYIAEVGYFDGPPAAPTVLLTFDGYYTEHQTRALPALQAAGVKATFTTGGGYYLNDPSLPVALAAAGMEVGQQVYQHIDYPQAGDSTYTSDLDRGIAAVRGLASSGLDYRLQSMPYNDITKSQVSIAGGRGVRLVRESRVPITMVTRYGVGTGAINGAIGIGQYGTDNITRANLLTFIDTAVRYGATICLTTHQTITGGTGSNTTGSSTQTYIEDYAAMLAYGRAQGVQFMGMSEWLRSLDVQANKTYP